MAERLTVELVDRLREPVAGLVTAAQGRFPDLRYADLRLEVSEGKVVTAENGSAKLANDDYAAALGVRVLAGRSMAAPGHVGLAIGAADLPRIETIVREAIAAAYRRAYASAEAKAETRERLPELGASLWDTRLCPVPVARDVVPATYEIDPRSVSLETMVGLTTDVAREVAALGTAMGYSSLATHTELTRELFCSSEGAVIDQSFATTQGFVYVVAQADGVSQELYDVLGHQRGWEVLLRGAHDDHIELPEFRAFALALAREAMELVAAPALPTLDREVVVVTDPHYNALVAHEIVGHPGELDRSLKMETAYAGRSWLLRSLEDSQIGRTIASPLVSAYSDPSLPGYGHYRYDHEGTPGRRVAHIEAGVFRGFMNSRQTAALLGSEPNGHFKATDAALVPLIRMSSTVFAAGSAAPRDILREVDHGYYVVGHKIPSIAESRENFRISARRVYEIQNGALGRLYRDGSMVADTRDYLMHVDAVGSDLRIFPIPNCGKGQPMQTKRMGNGGPTMRSRARLAGG